MRRLGWTVLDDADVRATALTLNEETFCLVSRPLILIMKCLLVVNAE
jgi:hypothetical protein